MFKFSKTTYLILFAVSLFGIGAKISLLITDGLGSTEDLIFSVLLLFSLSVSATVFYIKLMKKKS